MSTIYLLLNGLNVPSSRDAFGTGFLDAGGAELFKDGLRELSLESGASGPALE